jgi:hypothetical protein
MQELGSHDTDTNLAVKAPAGLGAETTTHPSVPV